MTVEKLLKKYKLYTKSIIEINRILNVMWCDADYLAFKVAGATGLTEKQLAELIYKLILKSDVTNPEYDAKINEEMIRVGFRTNIFPGGQNHNKWNNGLFEDDCFGFGRTATDLYDEYQDSDFEAKRR